MISLFSCANKNTDVDEIQSNEIDQKVVVAAFQTYIDSADVIGSILIYDLKKNRYFSNDFEWAKKGNLPASTFKIPNSIIALETGVIKNDSTVFKWKGDERRLKVWEQDLTFKEAFHFSCVPCYQEVAQNIGANRMNEYLDILNYGKMNVDSTTIDNFWLEGESKINQYQQIAFLKRLVHSELPISQRTEAIIRKMIVIEKNETYTISGKTGWSIRNGNNNGWFVGFIEKEENTYFFATNVEPKQEFNMDMFPMIRKDLSFKALEHMGII